MFRFSTFKSLTRLDHTPFGLPFSLSAVLLATTHPQFSWVGAVLVVPCFILARISGMAFNQLIDRELDAKNPRTQHRMLPTGQMSIKQVMLIAWGSLFLFFMLALCVNMTTALLAPCAVILLLVYSYMKRIHETCHLVLGAIHVLGPVMSYAACSNSVSLAALCLGGAAGSLIVGTDIFYAIQDYDFDRTHALHSLPARFGIPKSLNFALLSHLICLQCLLSLGIVAHFSLMYYLILPSVAAFFCYFHVSVRQRVDTDRNAAAFFRCNVTVSCTVLLFITLTLWFN